MYNTEILFFFFSTHSHTVVDGECVRTTFRPEPLPPPSKPFPYDANPPGVGGYTGRVGVNRNLLTSKRSAGATATSPTTHGLTLQTLHFLGNLSMAN